MNSNPITSASSSNYVMGRTSEEYERLRRQSEAMEPITRSVLARVGLSAGMSCLDLGCGPGEVMRLMADQVGQIGRVVGIDVDARLGAEMLSILKSKGYQQCSFVEGNVESLEQIASDAFDLVFARFLLMHLDDPVMALRKMYSRVRPGGRIVVQDYYFPTMDGYLILRRALNSSRYSLACMKRRVRRLEWDLSCPHSSLMQVSVIPTVPMSPDFYIQRRSVQR